MRALVANLTVYPFSLSPSTSVDTATADAIPCDYVYAFHCPFCPSSPLSRMTARAHPVDRILSSEFSPRLADGLLWY